MPNEIDFQKILNLVPEEKRAEFFSSVMTMATPESVAKVAAMMGIKLTDDEAAAWLAKIQGMKDSLAADSGNLISGLMAALTASQTGGGKASGEAQGGLLDGLLSAAASSADGANSELLDKLKKAFLS